MPNFPTISGFRATNLIRYLVLAATVFHSVTAQTPSETVTFCYSGRVSGLFPGPPNQFPPTQPHPFVLNDPAYFRVTIVRDRPAAPGSPYFTNTNGGANASIRIGNYSTGFGFAPPSFNHGFSIGAVSGRVDAFGATASSFDGWAFRMGAMYNPNGITSLPPTIAPSGGGSLSSGLNENRWGPFSLEFTSDSCGPLDPGVLTISRTTLPNAVISEPYSVGIGSEGGRGAARWRLTGGSLPTGMTLNEAGWLQASAGALTASAIGPYTFSVEVRDFMGNTASKQLSLYVAAHAGPVIQTQSLPDAFPQQPYSALLRSEGGNAPFTWDVTSGSLPPGLTLLSSGQITGTLDMVRAVASSYSFTVRVISNGGFFDTRVLTIGVRQPSVTLSITKSGLGNVTGSLSCGITCSGSFTRGTVVTLNATPSENWGFQGWSGACTGTASCTITMDSAKDVHATFLPKLIINWSGNGSFTGGPVPCNNASCNGIFAPGTALYLVPVASAGWKFKGWKENSPCVGTGPCVITTGSSPTLLQAEFVPSGSTVTVSFGPLVLSITSKTGTAPRIWNLNIYNAGTGILTRATVEEFKLTQTGGSACSPRQIFTFPALVGDINPGKSIDAPIQIDFTGCAGNARFTLDTKVTANNGSVQRTVKLLNQFQ